MMRTLFATLAALFLAACSTTPSAPPQLYTLTAPAYEGSDAPGATLVTFVGPVTVPEAVDRPQFVMRTAANQVELVDGHRWAEPLKEAIPRVIAANLMKELGTRRISASRLATGIPADYRVALDVQRFESSAATGAVVEILWIIRKGNGETVRTGRTQAREVAGSGGPAELAAAHSRALTVVARDIAGAMRVP